MTDLPKPTGAPAMTINGVVFRCYQIPGIGKTVWQSEDGRCVVGRNYGGSTFYAAVDGNSIAGRNPHRAKRFRGIEAAMVTATIRAQEAAE